MCLIMETVRKAHVSPFRVFLQACVGIDPLHAEKMARFYFHSWLIDEKIPAQVQDFCLNILKRSKKQRRHHR